MILMVLKLFGMTISYGNTSALGSALLIAL
jgi:hypothetical protein